MRFFSFSSSIAYSNQFEQAARSAARGKLDRTQLRSHFIKHAIDVFVTVRAAE
jgi:hypothetical protein